MKQRIVFVFCMMVLAACGKPTELESESKMAPPGFKDVTNQSACSGTTPTTTTVFNQSWRTDYESTEGVQRKQVWTVAPSTLNLAVTCSLGSSSVTVQVRVNASVSNGIIQTMSNDQAEASLQSQGKEFSCPASLESGMVSNFTFQGPCLKIQTQGITQLMLPIPLQ